MQYKCFLKCLLFLALIGTAAFFLGRLLPKKWFHYDRFPYRLFPFEQEGNLYVKIGVRKWRGQFPDMSVILPKLIPSKRLPQFATAAQIEMMVWETCVAEWIHKLLVFAGFGCVLIWESIGGWIVSLLYALGNIPYIIIQRYNRPKLIRLFEKLSAREIIPPKIRKEHSHEKSADTKLQYGRGA